MTKTKLEYATILANLRKDGSDPKQLAQDMSMRKLLYEIEKLEVETPPPAEKKKGPRPFWAWLTQDSSDEDQE